MFVHSLIHSSIQLLIHSFTHPCIHSFSQSVYGLHVRFGVRIMFLNRPWALLFWRTAVCVSLLWKHTAVSAYGMTLWMGNQTRYRTDSTTNIRSFDDNPCHPPSLHWITVPVFHSFIQTQNISFIPASCKTGTHSARSASSFCVNPAYIVFPFSVFLFIEPRGQQGVPDTSRPPHIKSGLHVL